MGELSINVPQTVNKKILRTPKAVERTVSILRRFLPILAFIIPLIILYSLYPQSFHGDPTWEGTWQGRFLYLFFLWIFSLEIILNWERFQTSKVGRLKHRRTVALVVALLLPTAYVIVANYYGLNDVIVDLAEKNQVPHASLFPLSTEYLVLGMLFNLTILLMYGINGLRDFSISALFLGVIGVIYTTDVLYPFGRFTPFQIFVPTTATLAANFLNLLGYGTILNIIDSPVYGSMPSMIAFDSQGRRSCAFSIAWPCAGVESLLIYTVTIMLFLRRIPVNWRRRMVYFVFGAIVTYLINVLRIVSIFVISIPCYKTTNEWLQFHNIYGPLISITWIISYPLIIIGSRDLWRKIRHRS